MRTINATEVFTINGLNKEQAHAVGVVARRAVSEQNALIVSASATGVATAATVHLAKKHVEKLIQAAPTEQVGEAASAFFDKLKVTDGTRAADVVRAAVPVAAGVAVGALVGYGLYKASQYLINRNSEFEAAVKDGAIIRATNEKEADAMRKAGVGMVLGMTLPKLKSEEAKKPQDEVTKDAMEIAQEVTQVEAVKS